MKDHGVPLHTIVYAFLFIFLSSCTLFKPLPAKRLYNIAPALDIKHTLTVGKSIKLVCVSIPVGFHSKLVYQAKGRHIFVELPDSFWMDTPCNMIKLSLAEAIFSSGLFSFVNFSNAYYSTDYRLLFSVESFYFRLLKHGGFVDVRIRFILINSATGKPVSTYLFYRRLHFSPPSIPAAMETFNRAVGLAIKGVIGWLASVAG